MELRIHAQLPKPVLAWQRTQHQTRALQTLTWKQGRLALMLRPHGMGQRRPTTDVITRHWVHHHQPIQAAVSVTLRKLLSQLTTEQIAMTADQRSTPLMTGH
jgi:hypothetical protein